LEGNERKRGGQGSDVHLSNLRAHRNARTQSTIPHVRDTKHVVHHVTTDSVISPTRFYLPSPDRKGMANPFLHRERRVDGSASTRPTSLSIATYRRTAMLSTSLSSVSMQRLSPTMIQYSLEYVYVPTPPPLPAPPRSLRPT